jgi:hypothetical protein
MALEPVVAAKTTAFFGEEQALHQNGELSCNRFRRSVLN